MWGKSPLLLEWAFQPISLEFCPIYLDLCFLWQNCWAVFSIHALHFVVFAPSNCKRLVVVQSLSRVRLFATPCKWHCILKFGVHLYIACLLAKSRQSCPTLCDPIDGSPTGSPAPGILQARTLEWVAISFSNAWKWKVKVKSPSRVRL